MSSSAPHHHDDSAGHEVHEGPIKTPRQLFWAVLASFVVPIVVIIMLANYVTADKRPAAGSRLDDAAETIKRIRPVAADPLVRDPTDFALMKTGEQVYTAQCAVCHAAGLAGAPKFGDAVAWGARIKTGYDALLGSVLKGKGAMGAQGGGDHSDYELARAVVYMSNQAGAKFDEPKAPAAATGASTGAAPATASVKSESTAATAAAPVAAVTPAPAPSKPAEPAPAPASTNATSQAVAATAAAATVTAVAAAATQVTATPQAESVAAAMAASAMAAPALYSQACAVCHAAGVAGAPKLGDKVAWATRVGAGLDGLTASVVKGKGAMPARGGSSGSDADIKAAVNYMLSTVK
jgi:cytochrome c5